MKNVTPTCCGTKSRKDSKEPAMEIPAQIQKELDELGGFESLTGRVPDSAMLEQKSRVYHALSDPLRLTILYLIKDQPLCVCVINRFTRISGSKLSYHLNILKESGLVESEYQGNWIIYSLTDTGKKFVG
jgi:ArsR family transcriptional regulator, arsenate/arsenite/antimonite-responsive transcriptional repressor